MCSCCSAVGDLYTMQAKAAPPPAGVPPLLEALPLNRLDINTLCVPDAMLLFFIKLDNRCCHGDLVALSRFSLTQCYCHVG